MDSQAKLFEALENSLQKAMQDFYKEAQKVGVSEQAARSAFSLAQELAQKALDMNRYKDIEKDLK